ncbi:MAG: hypothetical protein HYS07_04010 [Chlamydiae bacterium]|nr:hypothetical protein [Chlamydiota bacterium]MBI3277201.1 hypothetical protein [Chlamydiota bacterium]
MNTKSLFYIAISIFVLGLPVEWVASAQKTRIDDPEKYQVASVIPKLETLQLKEGLNLVQTVYTGESIYARVKNGQVTGWVVKDSQGNEIPTTFHQRRARGGEETRGKRSRPKAGIRCWHCYEINGETHCFETKCPWDKK